MFKTLEGLQVQFIKVREFRATSPIFTDFFVFLPLVPIPLAF